MRTDIFLGYINLVAPVDVTDRPRGGKRKELEIVSTTLNNKISNMNKMAFLSLVYTILLIIPGPILGKTLTKTKVGKEKRQAAAALLPLASYAGMTVSAPVFLALEATYGIYAVIRYAIRSRGDSDSHTCANNRGWCRRRCQSHEIVDWYHSDICGSYKCCPSLLLFSCLFVSVFVSNLPVKGKLNRKKMMIWIVDYIITQFWSNKDKFVLFVLWHAIKGLIQNCRAQVLLPLASYAGLSVTGPLFLALVAAYGVYAVVKYGIKSDHDSHSCANNRGWCRAICFDHEVVDHYHSDICGAYKCCR
ncbi:Hypothetical predicted protein [Mytilus galloprovincialis]|uniref:Big defensin domain-containing protein n=1 Tax=Mytilus galloprovincialis TaxID=29158 RepID=A0A8B6CAL1_MYTGA|nr:Hypothetical predicted protein [Mytilus galloprovincialis]